MADPAYKGRILPELRLGGERPAVFVALDQDIHDPAANRPFRALAVAILSRAVTDLEEKLYRRGARRFLAGNWGQSLFDAVGIDGVAAIDELQLQEVT